jgi:hypothetical protein
LTPTKEDGMKDTDPISSDRVKAANGLNPGLALLLVTILAMVMFLIVLMP